MAQGLYSRKRLQFSWTFYDTVELQNATERWGGRNPLFFFNLFLIKAGITSFQKRKVYCGIIISFMLLDLVSFGLGIHRRSERGT